MFLYAGIALNFGLFRHFSYRKNLTNILITPHVFVLKRSTNSSTFCAFYAAWASWALSDAGCVLTAAAVCDLACSRSISSCAEWNVAWA